MGYESSARRVTKNRPCNGISQNHRTSRGTRFSQGISLCGLFCIRFTPPFWRRHVRSADHDRAGRSCRRGTHRRRCRLSHPLLPELPRSSEPPLVQEEPVAPPTTGTTLSCPSLGVAHAKPIAHLLLLWGPHERHPFSLQRTPTDPQWRHPARLRRNPDGELRHAVLSVLAAHPQLAPAVAATSPSSGRLHHWDYLLHSRETKET